MRFYLDTEFYEDGKTIDLISIALVREDGHNLYMASTDAKLERVSPWLREHVLPQLPPRSDTTTWKSRAEIRDAIVRFTEGTWPEFWAYYADYDWIAFCQLFGTMMELPAYMPRFCMDLKQLAVMKGNPTLPAQEGGEHNALEDARWNRQIHAFLDAQPWQYGAAADVPGRIG